MSSSIPSHLPNASSLTTFGIRASTFEFGGGGGDTSTQSMETKEGLAFKLT